MPSSYHVNSTFFTTLIQTDPNSLELLKPSPFQRSDFTLGEGLRALERDLPISPLLENIHYIKKRPGHVFWRPTEKLSLGKYVEVHFSAIWSSWLPHKWSRTTEARIGFKIKTQWIYTAFYCLRFSLSKDCSQSETVNVLKYMLQRGI